MDGNLFRLVFALFCFKIRLKTWLRSNFMIVFFDGLALLNIYTDTETLELMKLSIQLLTVKKNKQVFCVINCTCSDFRKRTKHNIWIWDYCVYNKVVPSYRVRHVMNVYWIYFIFSLNTFFVMILILLFSFLNFQKYFLSMSQLKHEVNWFMYLKTLR